MKINKEIRQLSKQLLRASFTDGQLDLGKVSSFVQALIEKKPRHCLAVLENYKRLLRLELQKHHVRIESANELSAEAAANIVQNLKQKYGNDLTTEFIVDPALLGGIRVRVGSDVWDGTVLNRLERLANQL